MAWLWNLIPAPLRIAGVAAVAVAATVLALSTYDRLIDDPGVRREALRGYVLASEKSAAEAVAAKYKRQNELLAKAAAQYADVLTSVRASEAAASEQLETEIARYEVELSSQGRSCRLADGDIEFLRQR